MTIRNYILSGLTAAVALSAGACGDDFFEVRNPNHIDDQTIDPVENTEVLSRSAFQNLAVASSNLAVYTGWFSNELWVGDTFPTRNQFGRRLVETTNNTHNDAVWAPLSRALSTSEDVLERSVELDDAESNLNVARAAFTAGYSYVLMAESFCRGVERGGPALDQQEMLDRALERFSRAYDIGVASDSDAGSDFATASLVGQARALLHAGDYAEAATVAEQVPVDFEFSFTYVDQADQRGRLGNTVFSFSAGGLREGSVVPPHYRAMADAGDPRISYEDAERDAQDGVLRLYSQGKYRAWDASIRAASTLEARYIAAEAALHQGDPTAALALIAERRKAGKQDAFEGTGSAILVELMDQRSRDFWLEAQRMGDWRRNGDAVPNILQPGPNYYKPSAGETVGDQICLPLPNDEVVANENIES